MNMKQAMTQVQDLIQNIPGGEGGFYVLYFRNKELMLTRPLQSGGDIIKICNITPDEIRKGLTYKRWESITEKVVKISLTLERV